MISSAKMDFLENMGFCPNFDFFAPPPSVVEDGEMGREAEPEAGVDDDYSDEEVDVDELERRMWRDRMLLKKLKEQSKDKPKEGIDAARMLLKKLKEQSKRKPKEGIDAAKQRQSQEQARRKKMSRAQDGIRRPPKKYLNR